MSTDLPRGLRYAVARVTLELTAPLTIGTGRGDDLSDSPCVLDANGLPTLPGSSLAGVLRSAWRAERGDDAADALFGHVGDHGAPSRVELSWGQAHDAHDRPVPLRASPALLRDDPVLQALLSGVLRDHVRISDRGVADDTGKFDELLVPAGARFTLELLVHAAAGAEADDALTELRALLGLLASPHLRIGGRTRRGYGAFTLVRTLVGAFDLLRPADRQRALRLPRELHAAPLGAGGAAPLVPWTPAAAAASAVEARKIPLTAQDLWIFGTGAAVRDEHRVGDGDRQKAHDKVPLTERAITWTGGRGAAQAPHEAPVLIPATAIKGALRHRALYHARRRAGLWADPSAPYTREAPPRDDAALQAIEAVFGAIKSSQGEETGHPGRVLLRDIRLRPDEAPSLPVQHVSLDRFTQGPMDGLLFSEAPNRAAAPLVLQIELHPPRDRPAGWSLGVEALNDALLDLVRGRLALGAGANRGHGYFSGPAPTPFPTA